jgi:hypothetical protein
MNSTPSLNGSNGRDGRGRFVVGNPGGPGNPYAKRVNELRSALFRAVDAESMEKAAAAVLEKACDGDIAAFRELCNRTLGLPSATEVLERLAAIEEGFSASRNERPNQTREYRTAAERRWRRSVAGAADRRDIRRD